MQFAADQVELELRSGGTQGTTLQDCFRGLMITAFLGWAISSRRRNGVERGGVPGWTAPLPGLLSAPGED